MIWLIGNWVTVKLSVSARPVVYSAILSLLAEQEDLVVRMEAALTLKAGIYSSIIPTYVLYIYMYVCVYIVQLHEIMFLS